MLNVLMLTVERLSYLFKLSDDFTIVSHDLLSIWRLNPNVELLDVSDKLLPS